MFFIFTLFYLLRVCYGFDPSNEPQQILIDFLNKYNYSSDTKQNQAEMNKEWKLRYFPEESKISTHNNLMFSDRGATSVDPNCDSGKTNFLMDRSNSIEYDTVCKFDVDNSIEPILHSDFIPPAYVAPHVCTNLEIEYPDGITTFGNFRPLWARFGEYKFIPRERWLHNAEKGAIIMLYHPCADPNEVHRLRKLVTSCIFRHIITPYNLLPKKRPLALVTWGRYLNMNVVYSKLVLEFIKKYALQGPENIALQGKYDNLLINPAEIVSDNNDRELCPVFA